ncbi:MAG: DUF4465 domain-containing protein [Verrucomicrobiota bacterium JB022]|nr:DUF4465 domain-containing protein [Verrucomicrobiota bacterium JB022]
MPLASSFKAAGLLLGATGLCASLSALQVVDFNEFSLPAESYYQAAPGERVAIQSKGATFYHTRPSWGGTYNEFTYSNSTDNTTPGFSDPSNPNDASAYTGSGDGDANYGMGYIGIDYTGDYSTIPLSVSFEAAVAPQSISLTNSTYAALSMLQGDAFAKQFGGASGDDADYFLLTISGYDASNQLTGIVDFYLADFRFADNSLDYIVDSWETVDLTALGLDVTRLDFNLSSSDTGMFGMNTPSYFAFDNLAFEPGVAVPEPRTVISWLGLAALAMVGLRRRAARS